MKHVVNFQMGLPLSVVVQISRGTIAIFSVLREHSFHPEHGNLRRE